MISHPLIVVLGLTDLRVQCRQNELHLIIPIVAITFIVFLAVLRTCVVDISLLFQQVLVVLICVDLFEKLASLVALWHSRSI